MHGTFSANIHLRALAANAMILTVFAGCATTTRMTNTSEEKYKRSDLEAEPIKAQVAVVADNDEASVGDEDAVSQLRRFKVFEKIESGSTRKALLVLSIKSRSDGNHNFAAGMGKAVLSGLTFGLADSAQSDYYDYWIELNAELSCKGKEVGRYTARGSYESEVPESSDIKSKQERVEVAVANSIEHAYALLATKIKQDRDAIYMSRCAEVPLDD